MLTRPIAILKGTLVEFVAEWDNSADNLSNPDPAQTVKWGPKTDDEMFRGIMYYTQKLKKPITVKKGIEVVAYPGNPKDNSKTKV